MTKRSLPALDPSSPASVAQHLAQLGYHCLPVVAGSKAVTVRDWQTLRIPPDQIPTYWKEGTDSGVGLLLGQEIRTGTYVVAVDVDVEDEALIERIGLAFSHLPPRKKGLKGTTFFARSTVPVRGRKLRRRDPVSNSSHNCVELLAGGNQTVIPPSIHPSGCPYEWQGVSLCDLAPEKLPLFDQWTMREIEYAVHKPDHKIFGLNEMVGNDGKGGGTIHNTCVEVTGSLVAMGWDADSIWARVQRATARALSRHGAKEYDWAAWEHSVRRMIKDAFDKGYDKVSSKAQKQKIAVVVANWVVNDWYGEGKARSLSGKLALYDKGHFSVVSDEECLPMIHRQYPNPEKFSLDKRDLSSIFETALVYAPSFYPEKIDRPPGKKVCLQNGTFDMDTLQLDEWSPDDLLVSQLPFSFDPNAKCPVYERFLGQCFDGDEASINVYEEFLSHTLFDCLDYQKFLVIKGRPATGKSTLLHIARMLHSNDAVSNVGIDNFGSERYKARMVGKLLNMVSEVAATSHAADDFLKSVTSGDWVEVRYLYRETYSVRLMARILIACNEMFRVRDNSGAIERRMLILSCDNQIPEKLRDAKLPDKIQKEMPGVFNRLVKAWERLRERGHFVPPTSHTAELDRFSEENNHVLQWLNERTHQGVLKDNPDHKIPNNAVFTESSVLFLDYSEWAKLMNFKPLSVVSWGTRLTNMNYPSIIKSMAGTSLRIRELGLINGVTKNGY